MPPLDLMRAALYARLSREDRTEEELKIARQLERCREYVATQEGWTTVAEEIDDGISGTVKNRPGLQRLLSLARSGQIDVVVARDQDRIARGHNLPGWVWQEFTDAKVRIVTLHELGTSTFEKGVRKVFGAEYVERARQLITDRMLQKAERLEFTGGIAPYGYRWVPTVTPEEELVLRERRRFVPRRMVIVPDEAEVVRRLFAMLDPWGEATSFRAASRSLGWSQVRALRSSRNPAYAGGYLYGRKKAVEGRRNAFVRVPRSEWNIQWDAHEAIVDRERWQRVQSRLDGWAGQWTASHRNCDAKLPLTGLLRCSVCGGRMAVSGAIRLKTQGGRLAHYYACRRWKQADSCVGNGKHRTDGWTLDLLFQLVSRFDVPAWAKQLRREIEDASAGDRNRECLEADVARRTRAVDSILSVLRSGDVRDTRALARELEAAQEALRHAQRAAAGVRRRGQPVPSGAALQVLLRALTEDLGAIADEGAPETDLLPAARPVLQRLLERITVEADGTAVVDMRKLL